MAAINTAQHQTNRGFLQLTAAKCNGLIGQAQCIAHGPSGGTGQQLQSHGLSGQVLLRQDLREVFKHCFWRHGSQVKLQAPRQNSDRYFLGIGGGQYKLQILRRLFKRFQHGIEGRVGQHVNLVNHEHLEAPLNRFVNRLFKQALNFIDTSIGGGIKLRVIDKST